MTSFVPSVLKGVFIIMLALQPGFTATAAAGDGLQSSVGAVTPSGDGLVAQTEATPTPTQNASNTTASSVRHRNPETQGQHGDLADIQRWLGGNMRQVIVNCADGIQNAEYAVCSRLDEDYPDWMSKYIDVARATDTTHDNNVSTVLNDTRQQQLTFAQNVRQFRTTYDEYQQARQNGNEGRARELARDLQRLSEQVNQTGTNLRQNYDVISGNSSVDLAKPRDTITAVQVNVTQRATNVTSRTFTTTVLTIAGNQTTISYQDPLRVTGHLETATGAAITNRQIQFQAASSSVTTETDSNGDFSFVYHPRTIRTGQQNLSVSYRPAPRSEYRSTNASLPVTVEQTRTELTIQSNRSTIAFADRLRLSGRLTAAGAPVGTVPVVVTLNGVPLVRTTTDASGSYNATAALPAAVPLGDQTLRVTLPFSDRALTRSNASTTLTVEPTTTSLSLSARAATDSQIRVQGELRTAGDTASPVSGQTVVISIAGDPVTRVQTTGTGGFMARLTVPKSIRENRSAVTVTAHYRSANSNLLSDRASTRITLSDADTSAGGGSGDGSGGDGVDLPVGGVGGESPEDQIPVLLGGFAVVVAVGGGALWMRGLAHGEDASTAVAGESDTASQTDWDDGGDAEFDLGMLTGSVSASPLERARDAFVDGDLDTAVITTYVAVRRALSNTPDDERQTHWEFYTECQPVLEQSDAETLRTLTEAYEQAMFSPYPVTTADARQAITVANTVMPGEDVDVPHENTELMRTESS